MRTAVAILTYVPAERVDLRCRLPNALWTLLRHAPLGVLPVFIIDDGSDDQKHLAYLDGLPGYITVIKRPTRGGIARAKNTCIRVLMEAGVDIGFIAEDDIEFRDGWWWAYTAAHQATGIDHFSWSWDNDPGEMWRCLRRINGATICQTSRVNGVLLSCTPRVIKQVGGFKVLPAPWGHEHTNWTKRIIAAGLAPYFCDVPDSNRLISLNQYSAASTMTDGDKSVFSEMNEPAANEIEPIYQEIIE